MKGTLVGVLILSVLNNGMNLLNVNTFYTGVVPVSYTHLDVYKRQRRVFASLTVLENLKLGAYTRKDKEEINASLEMVYKRFPRLEERKDVYKRQLGFILISYYLFAFCTKIYHNRKESQDEGNGGIFYIS